jgi:hypothetical protein
MSKNKTKKIKEERSEVETAEIETAVKNLESNVFFPPPVINKDIPTDGISKEMLDLLKASIVHITPGHREIDISKAAAVKNINDLLKNLAFIEKAMKEK